MSNYVLTLKKRVLAANLPPAANRELLGVTDERDARELLVLDDEHGVFDADSPAIQLLVLCITQRHRNEDLKLLMEFLNFKPQQKNED